MGGGMSAAVACPHRARQRPAHAGSGQAAGGPQAAARPGAEAYAAREPGAGGAPPTGVSGWPPDATTVACWLAGGWADWQVRWRTAGRAGVRASDCRPPLPVRPLSE